MVHTVSTRRGLKAGASLLAMATMGLALPALAQTAPGAAPAAQVPADNATDATQDVVVTGVRRALETSQTIKRNADTFVDSITATDIGAFPDQSAAEALQRVPGISVNRLQSADDSTHPSGEPTGVLIRGLPQVRTEFNGRDSFSADSARGLNFNDISPELLSGVDAYKNLTAEMIEGGIAGSVNLRTRLPFDHNGLVVTGNARANYGDRSKRWTPEFSGLISDTWETGIGKFGLLADYAYSHVVTRTDSVIMDKIDTYCTAGAVNGSGQAVITSGKIGCTANPFGGSGWAYAPDGIRYSQVDYDRHRHGWSFAGQYENETGSLRATVQYTDSEYHNSWLERASHAVLDGNYFGTPAFNPRTGSAFAGSSGLTFGSNGMLSGGILTQPHGSWAGSYDSVAAATATGSAVPGVPFVNYCGAGVCGVNPRDGLYFQNESRDFDHREGTKDLSGHIDWDISDRLHAAFDAQHVTASTYNNDILVATGSMANYQYSTGPDGVPMVTLQPGSNVNYAAGGLANPHNYWIPFIQGHLEDNDGHENAFRGDLQYDFARGGWLDSLRVGVRYADRSQTVRYSTFNWTPIAANWNCNGAGFNADNTTPNPAAACNANFKGYGSGLFGPYNIGGLYNGSVYPNGSLVFVNQDALTNYTRLMQGLSGANTNSPIGSGYTPICNRPEATVGCFTPSEIMHLDEQTKAAYVMLRFGGADKTIFGGINVVGNVGVRVVQTRERSDGAIGYPTQANLNLLAPCGAALGSNSVVNPSCYLTAAIRNFANGGGTPDSYGTTFTNWLPSFNVRFGLDDKDFIRFAYSKAMSRPDIGLLRNYVQINSPVINTSPDSPYVVYSSPTAAHTFANVTGYNFVFQANAGNAALRPMTADQFDISFERYMGRSSSFTFDAFYKKLHNTVSFGQDYRSLTNNGSTQTVQINGPHNVKNGGTLLGFEAAYQTFFTFLPGLLNGLGMQVNYTFVHQAGITNSNLLDATSGGDVGASGAGQPANGGTGNVIDSHELAGISKHTFNIVGLYEKGPVGIRFAYNWRSRYLTQNLDCCIGLPVFQKSAGFLDGSIRFSLNRHIELSVEGTNLLGTTTVYQQEVFGDSPQTPGVKPVYMDSAWSRVDRRFQFGARVKF
ncbi:MAG: TonB-dependent receptor [Sphingomonas bacterium]|uniref:TonB-dependent receptor n=1 Tax=Sphingomonas bacterium TaxID=1895847 RepID=UPI00261BB50E|nr:TonB-dependent receptor [Sphingomonas bacterium]MDB5710120.1 TonB-dependent receptor [Sphingomonas bacterium]